jgi:hypothetical protein
VPTTNVKQAVLQVVTLNIIVGLHKNKNPPANFYQAGHHVNFIRVATLQSEGKQNHSLYRK